MMYSIIMYIIILLLIILIKPDFIYDIERKKYRDFGRGDGKTIFTLPIIAIFVAIIISTLFRSKVCLIKSNLKSPLVDSVMNTNLDIKAKKMYKYIYVPIEMFTQNMNNI